MGTIYFLFAGLDILENYLNKLERIIQSSTFLHKTQSLVCQQSFSPFIRQILHSQ